MGRWEDGREKMGQFGNQEARNESGNEAVTDRKRTAGLSKQEKRSESQDRSLESEDRS
jgi:hypothetical protein